MNSLPLIIFACAIAIFAVYKARQHRQRQIAANELAWVTLKKMAKEHLQQQFASADARRDGQLALFKEAFIEGYHANQGSKAVKAPVADLRRQNQALAEELQPLYQQLLKVEKEASEQEVLMVLLHLAFSEGGVRMFAAQGRKRTASKQQQLLRQRWAQLKAKAAS